jgi:hypothetical protein
MKLLLILMILFCSCSAKYYLELNKKASSMEIITGDIGLGGEENKDSAIIFVEIYSFSVGHIKKFTQQKDKKITCTINGKAYKLEDNDQITIKVPKGKLAISAADGYFFHYSLPTKSFVVGGNGSYSIFIYLLSDPNIYTRKKEKEIRK